MRCKNLTDMVRKVQDESADYKETATYRLYTRRMYVAALTLKSIKVRQPKLKVVYRRQQSENVKDDRSD